jgi:hypothetical protein
MALGGRGKRGGGRVIYYYMAGERSIVLLFMYAKNEKTDLTAREIALLVEIKNEAVSKAKEPRHE